MSGLEWTPLWLTLHLSAVTVGVLLLLGGPLAWWLARTQSRWKPAVEAAVAIPLVLPPTVLGFYLLILLGRDGWVGAAWDAAIGGPLTFTFTGLVIASCLYSLPFVVQPLQAGFERLAPDTVEAARMLGASRWRTARRVVLPQVRKSLIIATVLGFAHTMGEFGVVLMVGGNIPGETRVIAIAVFEAVETLDYTTAHAYSALLTAGSFLALLAVYRLQARWHRQAVGRA